MLFTSAENMESYYLALNLCGVLYISIGYIYSRMSIKGNFVWFFALNFKTF